VESGRDLVSIEGLGDLPVSVERKLTHPDVVVGGSDNLTNQLDVPRFLFGFLMYS